MKNIALFILIFITACSVEETTPEACKWTGCFDPTIPGGKYEVNLAENTKQFPGKNAKGDLIVKTGVFCKIPAVNNTGFSEVKYIRVDADFLTEVSYYLDDSRIARISFSDTNNQCSNNGLYEGRALPSECCVTNLLPTT